MALTADRNTAYKDGGLAAYGVAAATVIFAGALVAVNSSGYAVPASDTAGLRVVGRAEERQDNSAGADGALTVSIREGKVLGMKNSAGNAVTAADIGRPVYVEDDETVANAGGTNSIIAGICIGLDSYGVWVATGYVAKAAAVSDAVGVDVAAAGPAQVVLITEYNALLAALRTAGLLA